MRGGDGREEEEGGHRGRVGAESAFSGRDLAAPRGRGPPSLPRCAKTAVASRKRAPGSSERESPQVLRL